MTEPTDSTIDRLDLASASPVEDRMAALRDLFPEAVSESGIDLDVLRRELGDDVDAGPERFGLTWPGKAECMRVIQTPSLGTLVPMSDESVDADTTQNAIIEGENLEVLKLLQRAYHGQVKLIYIDPPYNTGKEFIYPDNFKEGLADYLRYSGQVDEEGLKLQANTETDGRYHSKWLSMMYPRLFLARNLLRDDGVIFVSIDDHEVHNLRALMNEVFGEENFIANVIWHKKRGKDNSAAHVSRVHDHIVMYARNAAAANLERLDLDEATRKAYRNPLNDPRGPYRVLGLWARGGQGGSTFAFTTRQGTNYSSRKWLVGPETMAKLDAEDRLIEVGDNLYRKLFLSESSGAIPETIWLDGSNNANAADELKGLFGDNPFDAPKPTPLIQKMLRIGTSGDDLILDFFAGSGSTGHAVMAENAKDGGRRRYVMVQLPEPVEDERFATIPYITRARVKAAGEQLAAGDRPLDHGPLDIGFRALRLQPSNFKVWDASTTDGEGVAERLDLAIDHISPEATDEALLLEITLKSGFPLTTPVEEVDAAGLAAYSVADGALLVCLARQLTIEAVEAMVERGPDRIVLLDAGFGGSDELKVNSLQTVRARPGAGGETIALQVV